MEKGLKRAAGRGAALLLAVAVTCYAALWLATTYFPTEFDTGFTLIGESLVVGEVAEDGPAQKAGLKSYDTIVAVEGADITSPIELHDAIRELSLGDAIRITVRMGALGQLTSFDIPLAEAESASQRSWLALASSALASCYPLLLLGITIPVLFRRPDSAAAWLWCGGSLGIVVALLPLEYVAVAPQLRGMMFATRALSGSLGVGLLVAYFLDHPSPAPISDRLPWLRDAAIGTTVIGGLIAALWTISNPLVVLSSAGNNGALLMKLALFAGFVLSVVALAGNSASPASERDGRLLTWHVVGAAVGLPALLLLVAWSKLTGQPLTMHSHWIWTPPIFASLLFPASMAYATYSDEPEELPEAARAIGHWLLAGRGALALWALLGTLLIVPAADALHAAGSSLVVALAVATGCGAVWCGVGIRLRPAWGREIDRRWFTDVHHRRTALQSAADALESAENVDEITVVLAEQIRHAVQPSSIAIYLADGSDQLRVRYGDVGEGMEQIPLDEPLPEETRRSRQRTIGEMIDVVDFGPDCLIPIRNKTLQGLIALGPHASDAPYSKEERQLMVEAAGRAGAAITRLSSPDPPQSSPPPPAEI